MRFSRRSAPVCIPWVATDAKFDAIRDNAQFRDLVSRIGLGAK